MGKLKPPAIPRRQIRRCTWSLNRGKVATPLQQVSGNGDRNLFHDSCSFHHFVEIKRRSSRSHTAMLYSVRLQVYSRDLRGESCQEPFGKPGDSSTVLRESTYQVKGNKPFQVSTGALSLLSATVSLDFPCYIPLSVLPYLCT